MMRKTLRWRTKVFLSGSNFLWTVSFQHQFSFDEQVFAYNVFFRWFSSTQFFVAHKNFFIKKFSKPTLSKINLVILCTGNLSMIKKHFSILWVKFKDRVDHRVVGPELKKLILWRCKSSVLIWYANTAEFSSKIYFDLSSKIQFSCFPARQSLLRNLEIASLYFFRVCCRLFVFNVILCFNYAFSTFSTSSTSFDTNFT